MVIQIGITRQEIVELKKSLKILNAELIIFTYFKSEISDRYVRITLKLLLVEGKKKKKKATRMEKDEERMTTWMEKSILLPDHFRARRE